MTRPGTRRWATKLAVAALGTVAVAGVMTTAAHAARSSLSYAMPAEGVFEACPLDSAFPECTSRLAVMRAGGVRVVVMNAQGSSLSGLAQYAAAAHDLGMSVIWDIGDPNWWQQPPTSAQLGADLPQFAAACGCSENQDLLSYVVGWLRGLPGTYGYYAADDSVLRPGDGAAVAAYMARIKQLDPFHPAIIGAYNRQQRASYQSVATIGQELYPITTTSMPSVGADPGAWAYVGDMASATQAAADRAGMPSVFILQAFSWGDNLSDGQAIGACSATDTVASCSARLLYPSPAEQLSLRNTVLVHAHPALILWWSFPGTYGSTVADLTNADPTGAVAAARWAGLSAAITAPPPQSAQRGSRRQRRVSGRRRRGLR